ncbi:hypothetical protein Pfo_015961, partial [Paulownia fortunei]
EIRIHSLSLHFNKEKMGCGESKHAVATENTVSKSKSKSLENNNLPVEKATNDEIVDARIQQKKENGNAMENKNPDSIKEGPEERKENLEGNDEKEGGKEKGVDDHGQGNDVYAKVEQEDQEEEERLISHVSPGDFLFPKRDHEETTESIISKEISGKSEYHSKGHVSERKVEENDVV